MNLENDQDSLASLYRKREKDQADINNLKIKALDTKLIEKDQMISYKQLQIDENENQLHQAFGELQSKKRLLNEKQDQIENLQLKLFSIEDQKNKEIKYLKEELQNSQHQLHEVSNNNLRSSKNFEIINQERLREKNEELRELEVKYQKNIEKMQESHNRDLFVQEELIEKIKKEKTTISEEKRKITEEHSIQLKSFEMNLKDQKEIYEGEIQKLTFQVNDLKKSNEFCSMEMAQNKAFYEDTIQIIKDQLRLIKKENEEIIDKYSKSKLKYKSKIDFLKNVNVNKTNEIIKEFAHKINIKDKEISSFEIKLNYLQGCHNELQVQKQELEFELNRQKRNALETNEQSEKTLEFSFKKLKQDFEVSEKLLQNENHSLEKKIAEQTQSIQNLTKNLIELEHENQILVNELAHYKKDVNPSQYFHKLLHSKSQYNPSRYDASPEKLENSFKNDESDILKKKIRDLQSLNDNIMKNSGNLQEKLELSKKEIRILKENNNLLEEKLSNFQKNDKNVSQSIILHEKNELELRNQYLVNDNKALALEINKKNQELTGIKELLGKKEEDLVVLQQENQTLSFENEENNIEIKRLQSELLKMSKNVKKNEENNNNILKNKENKRGNSLHQPQKSINSNSNEYYNNNNNDDVSINTSENDISELYNYIFELKNQLLKWQYHDFDKQKVIDKLREIINETQRSSTKQEKLEQQQEIFNKSRKVRLPSYRDFEQILPSKRDYKIDHLLNDEGISDKIYKIKTNLISESHKK